MWKVKSAMIDCNYSAMIANDERSHVDHGDMTKMILVLDNAPYHHPHGFSPEVNASESNTKT